MTSFEIAQGICDRVLNSNSQYREELIAEITKALDADSKKINLIAKILSGMLANEGGINRLWTNALEETSDKMKVMYAVENYLVNRSTALAESIISRVENPIRDEGNKVNEGDGSAR